MSDHLEHEEYQYLQLIRHVIENGDERADRTGVGTKSIFGVNMTYSLKDGSLPLITTKWTFWKGVIEELLWFISGCTDANVLSDKGIHIWDKFGSKEFLEKQGLEHYEEGDLGPIYGFQWRHFGAKYVDKHTDYSGQGIDQLANVIDIIKNNPMSRRIVMSAWNPSDLSLEALPPCHMFCQFYVVDGGLKCLMYQRSADLGLGVPFNIASYAILTHMIAHVCGLEAIELKHVIGDAHVYLNHIDELQELLERKPLPFPTVSLNADVDGIDSFTLDDISIKNYRHRGPIKLPLAV